MRTPRSLMIMLTFVNCIAAAAVIAWVPISTAQAEPAQMPMPPIRTERIELVDSSGQVRGQFFVEENGETVFRMRDKEGRIRVKLGASGQGSGLVLMDDRTEPGVQIRAGVSATTNQRETGVTLRNGQTSRTLTPRD